MPFPAPLAPVVIESQAALLDAVQEQSEAVLVTDTELENPAESTLAPGALRLWAQVTPD